MGKAMWKERLPGIIGTGLLTLVTALWTFWGTAVCANHEKGGPGDRLSRLSSLPEQPDLAAAEALAIELQGHDRSGTV